MSKFIVIFLILFFIFSSITFISGQQNETKEISLDEFIKLALNNSYFQEILMSELQLVYQERLKTPPGDLILSVLSEYQLNYNRFFNQQLDEEDVLETYHSKYGVGLSKLFSYSGTKVSGNYSVLIDNDKNQTHTLSFKFEQDIIKNAFGNTARFKKQIAGYEKQVAYYQVVEAYEEYLASIINLYIDWYSAFENLKYAEKSLQESQSLLKIMQNKLQYNIAHPIDLHKSELQVISKREQLSQMQLNYKNLLFQIKEVITPEDNTTDITPDFDSFFKDFTINLNDTYDLFEKQGRTAEIMKLINKTNSMSLVLAVDDLLPTAKLYGGYTFQKEYKELVDPPDDIHTFDLGVKMDLSIPQLGTFADYNNKRIEKDKKILNQKNKMHDLWVSFNILYQKVENEKSLLTLSDQKIDLSQKIVNEELKQYNQGLSSLNDLIQVYDALDNNRLSQTNHKISYAKYYIEWLRLSDTLVTNDKEIDLIEKQ